MIKHSGVQRACVQALDGFQLLVCLLQMSQIASDQQPLYAGCCTALFHIRVVCYKLCSRPAL